MSRRTVPGRIQVAGLTQSPMQQRKQAEREQQREEERAKEEQQEGKEEEGAEAQEAGAANTQEGTEEGTETRVGDGGQVQEEEAEKETQSGTVVQVVDNVEAKEQADEGASGRQHLQQERKTSRQRKFDGILAQENIDTEALREVSWMGVPSDLRAHVWRILVGYAPANASRREETLARKRKEYADSIPRYFEQADRDAFEDANLNQIGLDLPRTAPGVPLFQLASTQARLERILYIYAIRHPASGYVQGMNDLLTCFFMVFLSEYLGGDVEAAATCALDEMDDAVVAKVEADSYWCLSKLLDGVQDMYTQSQPGIQRMIYKLTELVAKVDPKLSQHLQDNGVDFTVVSLRWMNCMLMREVTMEHTMRMWDTYLSEPDGFSTFHVYVCAAYIHALSQQLLTMDTSEILLFLQTNPATEWPVDTIEALLSQAYVWYASGMCR